MAIYGTKMTVFKKTRLLCYEKAQSFVIWNVAKPSSSQQKQIKNVPGVRIYPALAVPNLYSLSWWCRKGF